jgi:hypothetical protein
MTIHELQAIIHQVDKEYFTGNYRQADPIEQDALIALQLPTGGITHRIRIIYAAFFYYAASLLQLRRAMPVLSAPSHHCKRDKPANNSNCTMKIYVVENI